MERALYQKYRPQSFKDVLHQLPVVSVLEQAVQQGSVAHAYLFTGPRGIGKTSVARIFAKELGCKSIDIFEIDAASHTGVEHIRDLTASVYTQPVESAYKVYILDEVHMLSKAAFNAFLKTLEEPPAYVVFILVTTEAEKVPETIVSRCISLSFRQPSLVVLQDAVAAVAKKEGRELSDQSAALIALMAEGSFRDSLTLLQKVLAVTDSAEVAHETAEEVLGAPKHQCINRYLAALGSGDVAGGVAALADAAGGSVDMVLFTKLCIRKVRLALLVRGGVAGVLDECADEDTEIISSLAKQERISIAVLRQLVDASHSIVHSYVKTLPLECLLLGEGAVDIEG